MAAGEGHLWLQRQPEGALSWARALALRSCDCSLSSSFLSWKMG